MQHAYLTTAMYHFVSLPQFKALREPLLNFCISKNIKGTLLLADEGINGTLAGPEKSILELLALFRSIGLSVRMDTKINIQQDGKCWCCSS